MVGLGEDGMPISGILFVGFLHVRPLEELTPSDDPLYWIRRGNAKNY